MQKVAIIGRGIIGSSWAVVFSRAGLAVSIWDRNDRGREAILLPIADILDGLRGTPLGGSADTLARISVKRDLAEVLRGAGYVQESVSEDLDLKRQLLDRIEEAAEPGTIIASSTSGLIPSVLALSMRHKERFLVVHPLTPPHLLPVTEIVPSRFTSKGVLEEAETLIRAVGQHPLRVHAEIGGFVLNRILAAMMNEFFHLIRDGVLKAEDADAALTEGFGLRWACMGPLAAMDLNAKGGIAEYLERYGYIFRAVAEERGSKPPLTDEVIARLAAAMRAKFPLADAKERARERDRAIATLRQTRTRLS
ncbi:MAG: 3-hydroxyacyl-CoA dehydrogenase [Proteobacteria bacterium]|nr:3-hydroxyacyl-CoA dehydrogenase [Pseudomonadota bacterium]